MRFEHDCDQCIPLGEFEEYDLYYCPGEPTVIARYDNDGGDYGSGLTFAFCCSEKECYKEAIRRACKMSPEYRRQIDEHMRKFDFPERYEKFLKLMEEIGGDDSC